MAGLTPDQLGALLTDELYVLTEAPYEYQEDDEEQFRAMLPHEVPEQTWVLSTIPRAASVGPEKKGLGSLLMLHFRFLCSQIMSLAGTAGQLLLSALWLLLNACVGADGSVGRFERHTVGSTPRAHADAVVAAVRRS